MIFCAELKPPQKVIAFEIATTAFDVSWDKLGQDIDSYTYEVLDKFNNSMALETFNPFNGDYTECCTVNGNTVTARVRHLVPHNTYTIKLKVTYIYVLYFYDYILYLRLSLWPNTVLRTVNFYLCILCAFKRL